MYKPVFKKRHYHISKLVLTCLFIISIFNINATAQTGLVKVTFINTANGKPLTLRDSTYTNIFDETYTISKLKYYISNFFISGSKQLPETDAYHLINAADSNNSFAIKLKPGVYKNISFLLGIDSAMNFSGAQTGGLDPVNDMFWTWNSGYVIFKIEGNSPSSTADLQRIEHHIGGFKGNNNVSKFINLNILPQDELSIVENRTTEIFIETNLDHYWKDITDIRISELPVCTLPGLLAKKIASNFSHLFSIKAIKLN